MKLNQADDHSRLVHLLPALWLQQHPDNFRYKSNEGSECEMEWQGKEKRNCTKNEEDKHDLYLGSSQDAYCDERQSVRTGEKDSVRAGLGESGALKVRR